MVYVPSASTRSDNDIFVAIKINSNNEGAEGCKRADYLLETHCQNECWVDQLASSFKSGVTDMLTGNYLKRLNRGKSKACLKKSFLQTHRTAYLYLFKTCPFHQGQPSNGRPWIAVAGLLPRRITRCRSSQTIVCQSVRP